MSTNGKLNNHIEFLGKRDDAPSPIVWSSFTFHTSREIDFCSMAMLCPIVIIAVRDREMPLTKLTFHRFKKMDRFNRIYRKGDKSQLNETSTMNMSLQYQSGISLKEK